MQAVRKIKAVKPAIRQRKRVAAYARVSKDTYRSMHSAFQQMNYFQKLIRGNPEWIFAGIYADEGISGKSAARRPQFQQMLEACRQKKIDLILTKSISRFARNTVDLVKTVRELKEMGIEVWFEEDHIRSFDADGELILTLLAAFAQAELETMSGNIKWVIRKKFQQGKLNGVCPFLGYRWDKEKEMLRVVPDEAQTVKRIFQLSISGTPTRDIARILNNDGIPAMRGGKWQNSSILSVLRNITYTGNTLLQKTYAVDPFSKRLVNNGEITRYYFENSHEAIISMEEYRKAQDSLLHLRKAGCYSVLPRYPFSQILVCGECGKHYRRTTVTSKYGKTYKWICSTKDMKGAKACSGKRIPERELYRISCETLGMETFDEERFHECVSTITVVGDDQLDFHLTDGTIVSQKWETRLLTKKGREDAERYCNTCKEKGDNHA